MYYNKNVIFVLLCLILLISGSFSAQVLKPLGLTRIKRSQPKSDYHVECKQSMTGTYFQVKMWQSFINGAITFELQFIWF